MRPRVKDRFRASPNRKTVAPPTHPSTARRSSVFRPSGNSTAISSAKIPVPEYVKSNARPKHRARATLLYTVHSQISASAMMKEKPDGSRKKKPLDLNRVPTGMTVLKPAGPCKNDGRYAEKSNSQSA